MLCDAGGFCYAHAFCGEGVGWDARNPPVRATAVRR